VRRAAALLAASLLLAAPAARAADPPAPAAGATAGAADPPPSEAQAKTYYDAGVQAYAAGRYAVAVQAFSEAYRLAPKPTLLFSLAQAERREYTVSHDARLLRAAIGHFRRYLDVVKEGGRRTDAVEALGELEAVAARLAPADGEAAAPEKPPETSRILITTATRGATVTLDGAEHTESPVLEEVKPGKHVVRVTAPGHVDEQREVTTVQGAVLPVEITLREKPSYISVQAPAGARVVLDGRPLGEAPLPGDFEVAPGQHVVTVTRTGHVPYHERVSVERGDSLPLVVSLPRTRQRVASYAVFATGVAALLTGGALGVAAHDAEDSARSVLVKAGSTNITQADLDRYNGALATRDDLRRGLLGTIIAGAALTITGIGLYLFDDPEPPASFEPADARHVKLSLSVGPGGAGLGLTGSF
jgi:hypothetical protein